MDLEKFKYRVGKVVRPDAYTPEYREKSIATIEQLPLQLAQVCKTLTHRQLLGKYRPEGWNIQQVVHHLADSHMNAYTRFKLALTEENPSIKPYDENSWAVMADGNSPEIKSSLLILEGLHERWVVLMKSMEEEMWTRSFYHPETKRDTSLNLALSIYEWHCRHHLQHVINAINTPF